jgi:hypothetical protein
MGAEVAEERAKQVREGVRRHRERMRAAGLRPVQFWVRDIDDPAFVEAVRRQCAAIGATPQDEKDQRFVDDLSEGAW